MDPVSIVQLVGTAVSLGDVVIKCIKRLHALKAKYHDAPLVISTITGQLYMVQAALDQLKVWNRPEYERDPRYRQLALQVDNFLDCFSLLILTLEQRLEDFESNGSKTITAKQKLMFLWGEKETSEYSALLDRQVNALNLLLQAVQCNTWAQQQQVIDRVESQYILDQARDFSSSIIGLEDARSFISEDTAGISVMFDFDAVILASQIYQQVGRSHLRQAIRARRELPLGQAHKEERPENSSQTTFSQLEESNFHANLNGPPEVSRHQAQGDEVTATRAQNLLAETLQRTHSVQGSLPSESLEQKQRRRALSNPQLPKGVGLSTLTRRPRVLDLWRTLRQKSNTDTRQKAEVPSSQDRRRNVLLLGTSGSGKTTLLKGLSLVLSQDYTMEYRLGFNEIIWTNIVQGIRLVLEAMEKFEIPLEDQRNEYHVQTIYMHPVPCEITPSKEFSQALSALWLDAGFHSAYERRHEYELPDNVLYFSASIKRLTTPDYLPTNADILSSRTKTTGITETWLPEQSSTADIAYRFYDVPSTADIAYRFYDVPSTADIVYRFYDVGGQRSERNKWIYVFDLDISTVLFTVDTTSYARLLSENETDNIMQRQLAVFESVGNDQQLTRSNFILIFTKIDLLEDWLRRVPVQRYFPDCIHQGTGFGVLEHYMKYLETRFLSLIKSDELRSRTRTIRANLVDLENQNPAMEVVQMLNELPAIYPEMSGTPRTG